MLVVDLMSHVLRARFRGHAGVDQGLNQGLAQRVEPDLGGAFLGPDALLAQVAREAFPEPRTAAVRRSALASPRWAFHVLIVVLDRVRQQVAFAELPEPFHAVTQTQRQKMRMNRHDALTDVVLEALAFALEVARQVEIDFTALVQHQASGGSLWVQVQSSPDGFATYTDIVPATELLRTPVPAPSAAVIVPVSYTINASMPAGASVSVRVNVQGPGLTSGLLLSSLLKVNVIRK